MKKYIALLRGINISGKNNVPMVELKNAMQRIKYKDVITYLNSGNIIFNSEIEDKSIIQDSIIKLIKDKFNIDIPVYVMESAYLEDLLKNNPSWWGTSNKKIYNNIIFIIDPTTYSEVCNSLGKINDKYEKIKEYNNSIFWSFDLDNYKKTAWWSKTACSTVSNRITIRTSNTMKKILEICK